MIAKTLTVFQAIVILSFQVVECTFITHPSNTAVVTGNTATLQCSTTLGGSAVAWSKSTTTDFIAVACVVQQQYLTEYNVSKTSANNCDLIILAASSSSAALYTCIEQVASVSSAYLTVIASTPTCTSNATTNLVPEHSMVSSSCNVNYATPTNGPTAIMTWSAGCTAQPPINTTTSYSSSAIRIAQRPTLQSCNCTTRFTAPPPLPNVNASAPSYSYTCSTPINVVNVSYCPTVTISPSPNNGFQYTTIFTCSADAYPNVATYVWKNNSAGGSSIASGQTFNVTSVGNYSISCEATNYLLDGNSNPCSKSATVTGTTIASYCPRNVMINETSVNTFLCAADASPPISMYQWTYNNTVIVGYDQTYTVPSNVNYTITCTVTNLLYNDTDKACTSNSSLSGRSQTVTTVETTPVSATVTQTTRTPDSSHTGGGTDTTAEGPTPSNKSLSAGEIAGIVVGIVVAAAIIIFALVFCLAPSCAANRECCMQRCKPDTYVVKPTKLNGLGEKYKKSEPNAPSANTGNGRNPPNNQTNEMETISSTTYPQHPDHSHQYNQHQTGYEQGSQGLIYAEFTKPGESLTGIHNQPGSRKPVTPQEENPYAAVERA